jgi:RNA polymerase sigma factor (TIGR02999 family)
VGNEAQDVITALLHRYRSGDREAYDELVSLVYERLRRIARGQLAHGWASDTLTPTALVHEAYVQLVNETGVEWQNRSHFYAICARTMRRTLVDSARRHGAQKRAGGARPLSLEGVDSGADPQLDLILAVDEALTALERFNERLARIVECRCLAGLTEQETASALGTSLRTVQRDWVRARAWLLKELGVPSGRGEPHERHR